MYATKSFPRETANIQNIVKLCQDQSIMLLHATVERKY